MNAVPRNLLAALLTLVVTGAAFASTPSSGTITTPTDTSYGVKQTLTFTGGPLAGATGLDAIVANTSVVSCQTANPPALCDTYALSVNLSPAYRATALTRLAVRVTWTGAPGTDASLNDVDLYLFDGAGNLVASSNTTNPAAAGGTGKAEEALATYTPNGNYTVLVTCSTCTNIVPTYTGTITLEALAPATPPPSTTSLFQSFSPPTSLIGWNDAGEPSIGVNQKTGNAMYISHWYTYRVSFDDSKNPPASTWTDVSAPTTDVVSADPILWMDPQTNRTYVSQLYAACSLMAYTDDDGATWFNQPIGCGAATAFDHQTVGGGPFAPPLTSTDVVGHYPHSVVYCAQADATAGCTMSTDGGITFRPNLPAYTTLDCGGLHGHVRVGPEGYLYLPNADCGGGAGLAISKDNGVTWTISHLPNSTVNPYGGTSDPWVEVASDGTIYYGYADGDGHARVAVSHDHGTTWSTPYDAGASQGVVNTEFAAVAVGDPQRAAFAFLGTNVGGDTQSSLFQGVWYLYVAFTYDGGSTWTTYNATPNDPVQRGCIWNQGGGNPCRNLLDFNGIAVDSVGRVLVAFADGCIDSCITAGDFTYNSRATIARQSAGLGLKAQYDGLIFKTAPGAPTLTGLAGNMVNHLSWTDGSTGNSATTGHTLYRGTASGAETVYKQLGTQTSYDDAAVVNGTTYYYRVSATNAYGTSSTSNEVALTPAYAAAPSAPQRLKATGKPGGILLTWSQPKSSGTAAITGYKIYRGTAPGTEKLLTSIGTNTRYSDDNVTAGTTYYYKVTAMNAVGESQASNEDSAQPK